MTTCEFFFPQNMATLKKISPKKTFCTISTELFLNRHTAKTRQNKKNTARSPHPHRPPFFFQSPSG
jgi:hypothetical protein